MSKSRDNKKPEMRGMLIHMRIVQISRLGRRGGKTVHNKLVRGLAPHHGERGLRYRDEADGGVSGG